MKHLDIDLASAFKNIHNLLNSHIFRETSEANGKKKVVDVFTVNYVDLRMIAQQKELVCDSADNNDVATLVAPYLSNKEGTVVPYSPCFRGNEYEIEFDTGHCNISIQFSDFSWTKAIKTKAPKAATVSWSSIGATNSEQAELIGMVITECARITAQINAKMDELNDAGVDYVAMDELKDDVLELFGLALSD